MAIRFATAQPPAIRRFPRSIWLAFAAGLLFLLSACGPGSSSSSSVPAPASAPDNSGPMYTLAEENAFCAESAANLPNQKCPNEVNGGETVYASPDFIRASSEGVVLLARTKVTTERIDPEQAELTCKDGGPSVGFTAIVPGEFSPQDDGGAIGYPVTLQ